MQLCIIHKNVKKYDLMKFYGKHVVIYKFFLNAAQPNIYHGKMNILLVSKIMNSMSISCFFMYIFAAVFHKLVTFVEALRAD